MDNLEPEWWYVKAYNKSNETAWNGRGFWAYVPPMFGVAFLIWLLIVCVV